MADIVIRSKAVQSTPAGYTVPGAQEILVKSVRAQVNGASAAGAFLPTLQLIAPDGSITWQTAASQQAAGASADVSWFPGVGGQPVQQTAVATLPTVALFINNFTVPSGVSTVVPWNQELSAHDPDGVFTVDLTTGIVTTTVTGVFMVQSYVIFTGTHADFIRMTLAGSAGTFGKAEISFQFSNDCGVSGALNSGAGQAFWTDVYQGSGANQTLFQGRTTVSLLATTP